MDKTPQLSNWTCRPLSPKQVEYARTDVHYLCHLAALLRTELAGGLSRPEDTPREEVPCEGPEPAALLGIEQGMSMMLHRALVLSQQATQQLYSKPESNEVVAAAAKAVLKRAVAEAYVRPF